ncbi:Na+/H+ antiporter NhaA, partial [Candidatus Peregrinibacteria bacterium]|nr:Na+/H+ antiporter NhaA [Candidatus Peregrinibacteria bacterium]
GIHPALALVPIIPTLPHAEKDVGLFAEDHADDALNAFEHWWKKPVELILMLFGFANAGVAFGAMGMTTSFVSIGLLVGKPVGIFLLTLLAVKVFRLDLPNGMNFRDVLVLGCMAGIGFTVALFVSTVAFPPGATQDAAKMGALLSFSAAFVSFVVAKMMGVGRSSKQQEVKIPVPPCVVTETKN